MNELIRMEHGNAVLDSYTAMKIAYIEKEMKAMKEEYDKVKEAVLKEMEANGVIKITTPDLVITYVAPTDRENFDKKKFRSDHPSVYDDYVSMGKVKASVRIKVKGE